MKQIVPSSIDSKSASPDRIFNDAMDDEPKAAARFNWLYLFIFIPLIYGLFALGAWSQNHAPLPPPTGPYESSKALPQSKIIVHVAGAVKKPGVYTLSMDARIQDALQKAGGVLPNGDANQLNLAAWAEDGSRIEVPFKTPRAKSETTPDMTPDAPLITLAKPPAETISEKPQPTKTPVKTEAPRQTKPAPTRKINLNKATLEELSLLPGVGPATAEKIIEHRTTNGAFSSVDDLDDIKGIGEKKIEKIRPYATVR